MTKHFFNTNKSNQQEAVDKTKKNASQEDKVYAIFERYKKLPCSKVYQIYCSENVPKFFQPPKSSINRAMSNLAYDGKLQKTTELTRGMYGAMEHYYEIVRYSEDTQTSLF